MIRAKFSVYQFDRTAREKVLHAVSTEWPESDNVDVSGIVHSLAILYPKAAGVRVDFMLE